MQNTKAKVVFVSIVGDNLKRYMRENNIDNPHQLELLAGKDQSYLSRLMDGKVNPISKTVEEIATSLGVEPEYFYKKIAEPKLKTIVKNDVKTQVPESDTVDDLLSRLKLATPVRIPVYPEFTLHAGEGKEVVDYVYFARTRGVTKNIEAYVITGDCLSPYIDEGDIVTVDREIPPEKGDLIVCLVNGEVHIAKYNVDESGAYLENRHGSRKMTDCEAHAVVLEVIKKVKKNYRWNSG